ncbi:MAG TPA: rhodanese-like domain-containing protein [Saprospiraceae bacterium]|nr:rhodanese-like domain-containing protein [Saprospiraceae bacterium]MCB9328356.1 rhodanese-like domain-containing protein [Lewinellaceae bacterium]HPK09265.1 rhodanese-like domain-containing protein [Saprospiraceae bacterium]HRX29944.1 rhodanese-like domain-containing protein [Saprospiraceae bacterium]
MNDISVSELKKRLDAGENIMMIDVREPYEREEFNIGGTLIPLGQISDVKNKFPNAKDDEIVVYCRSGARSGVAKLQMMGMGYNKVRNLTGGMMTWQTNFR